MARNKASNSTASSKQVATRLDSPNNLKAVTGKSITDLYEVVGEIANDLEDKPNVAYVMIGEKRTRGMRTGKRALIVYVTQKKSVSARSRIPKTRKIKLASGKTSLIKTDVVELPGLPMVFGLRSGHIIRADDGDLGICGLGFRHRGKPYAVTNAHVISNIPRHLTFMNPSVQDRTSLRFFLIGRPVYATNFPNRGPTDEDLAIILAEKVEVDFMQILDDNRPIASIGNFLHGENALFWYCVNGAKYQCAKPERLPKGRSVALLVDGVRLPYTDFWQLQVIQGTATPGHSGALICREVNGNVVGCGLLFGGVEPNFVYAFPLDDVMERVRQRLG